MKIGVASVRGAPGVTTLGYALAVARGARGQHGLLVEADPAGGELAALLGIPAAPGLVELAAAGTHQAPEALLANCLRPLTTGVDALLAPPSGTQATAALAALGRPLSGLLADVPTAVIDFGRLAAERPPELLTACNLLLLVVRPRLGHVAALLGLLPALQDSGLPLGVVIAEAPGPAEPGFPAEELAGVLAGHAQLAGAIPWDPAGLRRVLTDGWSRRSALRTAVETLLCVLGRIADTADAAFAEPATPLSMVVGQ